MLHHTKGVVFNYIKYSETSIIVRIFTEAFGMQSYIVNSARGSKAKGKIALYQPLTLLDLVVYHKTNKDLHRISEAKCALPFISIPFNPVKSGISLFLTEIFGNTLRHESTNTAFFQFLFNAISIFDHLDKNIENFHLQILLKSSAYLGFKPQTESDFNQQLTDKGLACTLSSSDYELLLRLLNDKLGADISIRNKSRREILTHILRYFRVHIDSLGEIKSLEILKEVLY